MSEKVFERLRQVGGIAAVVERCGAAFMITDRQGNIEYVNSRFVELTGYSPQEIVGKNPKVMKSGLTRPEVYKELWDTVLKGKTWAGELANKRKNGEVYMEFISISPVQKEDGEITHFVGVWQDVTAYDRERKKLSTEVALLQQTKTELENFAGSASHDLQAPLIRIINFCELLKQKVPQGLDDNARLYLARIESSAHRMRNLIQKILVLSKVSSGKEAFESVDLEKTAAAAVEDLQINIAQKGAEVRIGKLPTIQADPVQMYQLFLNLVGNAIKFQRAGTVPQVNVDSQNPGNGFVEITVADNGIGIPEDQLNRLFKPFERLHGSSEYEGSGIGLHTCKMIAERHKGHIRIQSAPGSGTTFTVTLPVSV